MKGAHHCPRVRERIECPECGYPASEAMHHLPVERDPGHRDKPAKEGAPDAT